MIPAARFERCARLLKAEEYSQVFNKAFRSRDQYFTVLAKPKNIGRAKLGLAVAKKKAKKAVSRNRLKRIIRESFRLSQGAIACADYVVMIQQNGEKISNKQLFLSLEKHWQNLPSKSTRSAVSRA